MKKKRYKSPPRKGDMVHTPRYAPLVPPSALTRLTGVCVWTHDAGTDDNAWEGTCGVLWELIEGTPKENEINFCPQCGKRVEQHG